MAVTSSFLALGGPLTVRYLGHYLGAFPATCPAAQCGGAQRLAWPLSLCVAAHGASTECFFPVCRSSADFFPERQTITSQTALDSLSSQVGGVSSRLCLHCHQLLSLPPLEPQCLPLLPFSRHWVVGSFSPNSLQIIHCIIFLAHRLVTLGSSLHVTYLELVFFLNFQTFLVCFVLFSLFLRGFFVGGLYLSLEFYKTRVFHLDMKIDKVIFGKIILYESS